MLLEILDSTLFEGGYVNNWNFGFKNIQSIVNGLEKANIDYTDVGAYQDNDCGKNSSFIDCSNKISYFCNSDVNKKVITVRVDWSTPLENVIDTINLDMCTVRIQFFNFNADKGIEYAKKIIDLNPNAHIIIHPIQTSHFSINHYLQLVNILKAINIECIFIDDCLGIMTNSDLKKYIATIHEQLPHCKIGIKTKMDITCLLNTVTEFDSCNFIIESTICGLGLGGISNMKTESLCEYCNTNCAKKYDIDELIKIVDWNLRSSCQKYGPISLLRGLNKYRKYDPQYINECSYNLQIWDYELVQMFNIINDRMWYSKETTSKSLRIIRSSYWKKKLCVIIPTYNRELTLEFCLKASGTRLFEYGVDLIIFDSSDNDRTKELVKKYNDEGYDNIIYQFYEPKDNGSMDQKIIDAYKTYSCKYDYIWICRDGIAITFDYFHTQLESLLNEKLDLIVIDSEFRDIWHTGNKHYTTTETLFHDQCIRMVTLGTIILSSEFALELIDKIPVDSSNYSLWQVISIFQYCANNPIKAASYCGNVFIYNPNGLLSSFWNSGGKAIWQWADRWYNTVSSLPSVYDDYKEEIYKIEMYDFHPFSLDSLLRIKSNNGLKIKTIRKNKNYLNKVHNRPIRDYYIISLIPIGNKQLRKMITNKDSKRYRALIKILHLLKVND